MDIREYREEQVLKIYRFLYYLVKNAQNRWRMCQLHEYYCLLSIHPYKLSAPTRFNTQQE